MSRLIPIYSFRVNSPKIQLEEISSNWQLHSAPYLASLLWFENLLATITAAKASKLVEKLSLTRKTMIKRGYQIKHENHYPPLMNGDLYDLNLGFKEQAKSNAVFPVGRLVKDRAGEIYVR